MSDREQDEQRDEKDEQRAEVEDLDVPPEESEDVKGGKVQMQDFHFTKRIDKTSPG